MTSEGVNDFATLGIKHDCDKVTHHGYQRFYPTFLEPYRHLSGYAMLEIGVEKAKSIAIWLEYFPKAFIYGIDKQLYEDTSIKSNERYVFLQADQSNPQDLERIATRMSSMQQPIFFINDDGSHIPEHQLSSFDYLFFHALMPGGVYIIEDIETSYWGRNQIYGYPTNYGYRHPKSIVEIFKHLVDDVNHEFLTEYSRQRQDNQLQNIRISKQTRDAISSITFGHNCIIIVKKTEQEVATFQHRPYRFSCNL